MGEPSLACDEVRGTRVVGVGSGLPERCVSNAELAADLAKRGIETSDDWIVSRTGIRQRYLADPGTTSSVLGAKAARVALGEAGLGPGDVDLIVCATSTPDVIFPSTACLVQKALGVTQGAAFDVQAVCSGFVYAMATADAMIRAGLARTAVVIGAEVFSRIMDWSDRSTCVLFGDGAGAVVLTATDRPGILASRLHADGSQDHILNTPGQVSGGKVIGHPFLCMDGHAVFKLAVTVLESVARETCEAAGVPLSELDWVIPHQANVRILQATGKRLKLPEDRIVVAVDQHANTSAASVPLAFAMAVGDGRIRPGNLVLLEGVGGGFTWGANLLRF